jgi:hypothetical protein
MNQSKPRHCKRSTGTDRAWFRTQEEAVAFANDPVNPAYHGDIAHYCAVCGFFHLSKPEWLVKFVCERCNEEIPAGAYFLILRNGKRVHEQCARIN